MHAYTSTSLQQLRSASHSWSVKPPSLAAGAAMGRGGNAHRGVHPCNPWPCRCTCSPCQRRRVGGRLSRLTGSTVPRRRQFQTNRTPRYWPCSPAPNNLRPPPCQRALPLAPTAAPAATGTGGSRGSWPRCDTRLCAARTCRPGHSYADVPGCQQKRVLPQPCQTSPAARGANGTGGTRGSLRRSGSRLSSARTCTADRSCAGALPSRRR
mmetsp:Transcript_36078/g.114696  ORF Transcript_36078/g.114696 Transcript_36078/m.114696 type:complete len:210 (+) Transcript_36078:20-649(+)